MIGELIGILASKGLPMLANALVGMSEYDAFTMIKNKTGLDLSHKTEKELIDLINVRINTLTELDVELSEVHLKDKALELDSEAKLERIELELLEAEEEGRENARAMEVTRSFSEDWLTRHWIHIFAIFGSTVIFVFVFSVVFLEIPDGNTKNADLTLGIFMGVLSSIFFYYFGTTQGSSEKNKTIHDAIQNQEQ